MSFEKASKSDFASKGKESATYLQPDDKQHKKQILCVVGSMTQNKRKRAATHSTLRSPVAARKNASIHLVCRDAAVMS
jgi:hypothetical protein